MNKVISKYKNPDKMIAKLKVKLESEKDSRNYWHKKYFEELNTTTRTFTRMVGRFWFSYSRGVKQAVSGLTTTDNDKVAVGQTVFLRGKIIELISRKSPEKNEATFELDNAYVMDGSEV